MSAATFPIGRRRFHDDDLVNPEMRLPASSSVSHGDDGEPMTKAEEAEMREAMHVLVLSSTTLNKALTHQVQQPTAPAKSYADRAFMFIPTLLMCATLLVTVGRTTGSTETDIKSQVDKANELAKRAQQNVLLLDTYNRELERAVIQSKAGIKLPTYPVLEK